MILSFDIGGTDLKYGVLNKDGDILHKGKQTTPHEKEALYKAIQNIFENAKNKFDIEGIGVSMPGIIDEKGYLVTAGALLNLYDTPMREDLEKITGVPVYVDNDANCATYAEQWIGYGKKYSNFIFLVIGTGIGGGLIINDQLVRGRQNAAGEFGFMQVGMDLDRNDVWNSWSFVSSVRSGLVYKYKEKTGEEINGLEIYRRKDDGDLDALACIESLYESLGRGIFNLIVSFDPEIVLIGGAISANEEFIEGVNESVHQLLKRRTDMKNYSLPEIKASKFYNDSGIIGAAFLVYSNLYVK